MRRYDTICIENVERVRVKVGVKVKVRVRRVRESKRLCGKEREYEREREMKERNDAGSVAARQADPRIPQPGIGLDRRQSWPEIFTIYYYYYNLSIYLFISILFYSLYLFTHKYSLF